MMLACSTCKQCNQPFTPKHSSQVYCSVRCFNRAPATRAARRASMLARRASGELTGRELRNARIATQREQASGNILTTVEPAMTARAADWQSSGERYATTTTRALAKDTQTLILAGYGASIRVERDALVVREGATHAPPTHPCPTPHRSLDVSAATPGASPPITHTFYRGMHGVCQIVCLNLAGSLSFEAVRWCAAEGVHIMLLGHDGALLQSLTPECTAYAALRRAQYQAQLVASGHDGPIAAWLLARKLAGQAEALTQHPELPGGAAGYETLVALRQWLLMDVPPDWLSSVTGLMTCEARAAKAYFTAWAGLPLRWRGTDTRRVPPHWRAIGARSSPLHEAGNRHAADPCNAMLNYAYGVLAGQCRLALVKQGFDVSCGFLHADKDGRDSLVYDLMECHRPQVDSLILDFIKRTVLHAGDCLALSDGTCRLHPQLARAVVAGCRLPQPDVDTSARMLAQLVMEGVERPAKTRPVRRQKRWVYQ